MAIATLACLEWPPIFFEPRRSQQAGRLSPEACQDRGKRCFTELSFSPASWPVRGFSRRLAAVSWAARLGHLNLDGSWLAFMGYAWTPWIFTLLALVEMVTDQLPSTPSRKVPMQFGARIVSGALSGATIGVVGRLVDRRPHRRRHRRGDRDLRRRGNSLAHGEGVRARCARRVHRGRRRHHPWPHRRLGAAMNRRFDAIVIGAGQAGPPMAGRLAAAGQKVALIERKLIGGTCVNTGCTPTKTLVASAYAAHLARRAADFGVNAGPVGVDFAAVMARKNTVVGNSRSHLTGWLRGMANCTLIEGHARFLSPTTVAVGDDVLEAERFFINVGGRAAIPDFPGSRSGEDADQHDAARTRRPAPAPRRRRRKLCRARVRADLSAASERRSRWWKRRRGSFRARTRRSRTRSAKSSRRRA